MLVLRCHNNSNDDLYLHTKGHTNNKNLSRQRGLMRVYQNKQRYFIKLRLYSLVMCSFFETYLIEIEEYGGMHDGLSC